MLAATFAQDLKGLQIPAMPPIAATCWEPLVRGALRWRARGIQSPADLPIEARREDPEARAAFAVWHRSSIVRARGPVGEACVLCGQVTFSWCESCEVFCGVDPFLEASAVCNACDQEERLVCHLCQEVGLGYPDIQHDDVEITHIGWADIPQ